jgi:hypothetical protein
MTVPTKMLTSWGRNVRDTEASWPRVMDPAMALGVVLTQIAAVRPCRPGVRRDPFFFSTTSGEKSPLLVPKALNPKP